jgi:O-antigen/teichoic acid export membrane protein
MALSFLHPSLLFLLLQLSGAAVVQGTTLLAGGLFGATAVATFVSLRTLSNLSQQGISSVRNALWPEVAAMDAVGDFHGLRLLHTLLAKLSMVIWLVAAVVLCIEGESLLRIWSKGRIPFDAHVLYGVLALYGSYAFNSTSSVLLGASNRHRTMTWLLTAAAALELALGWFLAHSLGLAGLVYGVASMDIAVASAVLPGIACRVLAQSYPRFLAEVLGRGILAAPFVVASAYAAGRYLPTNAGLIRTAALAAVAGITALGTLYAIWLDGEERRRVTTLVRRLVGG